MIPSKKSKIGILVGLAVLLGLSPLVFRVVQVRSEGTEMWRRDAIRSGYDPERYLDVRAMLVQSDQKRGLTNAQWSRVKDYMSSDKSGTFRQLCTALARAEAKRGRPDAIPELRKRLDDTDPYVVASTLMHLIRWLKVSDGEQIMARFSKDRREPIPGVIDNLRRNTPESESLKSMVGN